MARIYQIIRSRLEYLVIILLTTLLVAVVITLASPKEYEASARILIVQKQQTVDAFSASKSADYIAGLLNEGIYSSSFIDSLIKTDTTLASKLSSDPSKRSKEWNKKVDSSVLSNKGILSIKVYDGDSKLALHYASLIVSTLTSEGANYYGGNTSIDLRVIDAPLVTPKPARPSLATNIIASLFVGLALDIIYIFFVDVRLSRKLEEREYAGTLHEQPTSQEEPIVVRETKNITPDNLPMSEDPQERIENWMKKS